jgi:hypothetical protein
MKTKSLLFCLVLPCLVTLQAYGQEDIHVNTADGWTGSIKYSIKTTHKSPQGSGSDEWRLELTLSEGKIVATAINTFNKGGNVSCSNNIKGSQQGSETLNDIDFTLVKEGSETYFNIEAGMPVLKGNRTVCGKEETISQGDLALLIENLKVRSEGDVISGDSISRRRTKNGSEVFDEELQISVHLSRGPVEVELVVTPDHYEEWLPQPGKSEKEAGASINIGLKLQAKDGGEPKLKAKTFTLELKGTSKEPGIALNTPLKLEGAPAFDLAFASDATNQAEDESQKQHIESTDGKTATAIIHAYDGGGYTTLVAYAILENGKRIQGTLLSGDGPTEILLPKRAAGSRIAAPWLQKNGNPPDEMDEDTSPGNDNNGDGLTAYEEYRGVFSEGQYRRLDPRKKELGVQLPDKEKERFRSGMALLAQAAGIITVPLTKEELSADRILNKHSGSGHKQHALRLEIADLDSGVLGQNDPKAKLKKLPKESQRVAIDLVQLALQYAKQAAAYKSFGESMPFTLNESIAFTIAHELGHGIGLDHHGPPSSEIPRIARKEDSARFQVYGTNFRRVLIDAPFEIERRIGVKGNESSGDLSCIMVYTNEYKWAFTNNGGILIYEAVPLLPLGSRLCTSNEPTGINTKGYFGAATHGNCRSRFKIRDD